MVLDMIYMARAPNLYNIQAVLHERYSRVAHILSLYTLNAVLDGQSAELSYITLLYKLLGCRQTSQILCVHLVHAMTAVLLQQ